MDELKNQGRKKEAEGKKQEFAQTPYRL